MIQESHIAFISLNVTREWASFRTRNSSDIDLDISSDAVAITDAKGDIGAATDDVVVGSDDIGFLLSSFTMAGSFSMLSCSCKPSVIKNSFTDDVDWSNINNCSKMRSKQSKNRLNVMALAPMATDCTAPAGSVTLSAANSPTVVRTVIRMTSCNRAIYVSLVRVNAWHCCKVGRISLTRRCIRSWFDVRNVVVAILLSIEPDVEISNAAEL